MMIRFYQKNRERSVYSRLILVLVLIVGLFLGKAAWNAYGEMTQTRREAKRTEDEFKALSIRGEALAADIERLKTEEGVEKEIRKRFSVAKEGEYVAVIVDSSKEKAPEIIPEEKGFFGKFFDKIKSLF